MSVDPLLQPFQLRGLALRNRLMSSAHEPAYTDEGCRRRYRLYHVEKAKGGIGLTMIGGSSVVAPDSPQAFGNILLYKDEVVRWLSELADDVHAWRRGDDPDHASRAPHQLVEGRLAAGDRALLRARARASRLSQGHGGLGHRRVIAAYADAAERVKAGGLDGSKSSATAISSTSSGRPRPTSATDEYGGSIAIARASGSRCSRRFSAASVPIHRRRAHGLRRGLGAGLEPRRGHGDRAPPDPFGVD